MHQKIMIFFTQLDILSALWATMEEDHQENWGLYPLCAVESRRVAG